ncbi:hypothetical protein SLA2020_414390 [Shorea laevis]
MANTKLRCIFFFAVSYLLSDGFVGGRRLGTIESKELFKHKGTVKTIEGKDGEVIDCVDIYQQPAFNHPLLKNHSIQMESSSSIPNVTNGKLYNAELHQGWHENGKCPEGTIPIRHAREDDHFAPRIPRQNYDSTGHEYAIAYTNDGHFYGVHSSHNVWSPVTNFADFSLSQVWISSGPTEEVNTIEAGWQVTSLSKEPRFFIYWTSDGYKDTGCYNLECSGFVQTNNAFVIGSFLHPVSSYGATQFEIAITIYKSYGNWYLQLQDQVLGYWPRSLFTHLAIGASDLSWGGEIFDSGGQDGHTSTQMGSGHFPSEGNGKASFVRNLQYMDGGGKFKDAAVTPHATNPSCYDITMQNNVVYGTHFYFGGPGHSALCP